MNSKTTHHVRNLAIIFLLVAAGVVYWMTRPDEAQLTLTQTQGTTP